MTQMTRVSQSWEDQERKQEPRYGFITCSRNNNKKGPYDLSTVSKEEGGMRQGPLLIP